MGLQGDDGSGRTNGSGRGRVCKQGQVLEWKQSSVESPPTPTPAPTGQAGGLRLGEKDSHSHSSTLLAFTEPLLATGYADESLVVYGRQTLQQMFLVSLLRKASC